ncbi:MAG: FGGY-family carbohydrate kinase [bacterium]
MSLAGIDIGTTGTKVTVFDLDGRIIAQAYREYPLIFPHRGWIELDAVRVLRDARDALAEAAHKSRRDPIRAISISMLGEAAAPVGRDGKIIDNAIVGFDTRGEQECNYLVGRIGRSRLFRMTGAPPNHTFTICKLMWWKRHRKNIFKRARKFLLFEDLFFHSLGLPPTINYSLAARTMAFNIHRKHWESAVLDEAGIDSELLASPAASGAIVGEIPQHIARRLGLKDSVIAVAGGHDQICGAFGSGVIRSGLACDSTGTVECVTVALDRAIVNNRMLKSNFCCSPHVVPNMYATLAYNFTGGSLLRWFRDEFASAEKKKAEKLGKDVYDILLENAASEPTSLMVLPHFTTTGTPHFDPDSFGAILGMRFDTTRGDIIRALLEGVSMEIRFNIELLREAGVAVDELKAIGGGARSDYWLRLKSDIFGTPITALDVPEASALGAALLAGIATGVYRSCEDAVASTVRKKKRYLPNRRNKAFYEQKLKAYRSLYPALKKWAKRMETHEEHEGH